MDIPKKYILKETIDEFPLLPLPEAELSKPVTISDVRGLLCFTLLRCLVFKLSISQKN